MTTRREIIKCGAGLAAILAAGRAPAAIVRSMLGARNAMLAGGGAKLPYDAEVEYLESTGTQWIDTGLNCFADFEVGIKLRASVPNKSLGISSIMCLERINAINPYWRLNVNNALYDSGTSIVDYHVMSWKGGVFAADGVTVHTVSNPFTSGTMVLFGAGGNYYPTLIYACKLWDANGVLVRDFQPVRFTNELGQTEGAMYDRVSGKLFRNQGTGAFTIGPDIVPVEYIESTGTQYIALGLQGEPGYDFEYKIRFTQLSSSEATGIGGCYESGRSLYFGIVRTDGNLAYHYDGTSSPVVVQDVYANTDYTIAGRMISGSQYMSVNGVQGGNGSLTGTFQSSLYLRLFSVNSSSPLYSYARIYYFDLKKNGDYVRRLIPVRVGTEGAMMDTLTRGIYRNYGTGAFVIGPDRASQLGGGV